MNLHEYQTKEILRNYYIPVPDFDVASNLDEVKNIVHRMKLQKGVIKAQVHAGGRGKNNGIKIANTPSEIIEMSSQMLQTKFKNNQTLEREIPVNKVLISEFVDIQKEYYFSIVISRESASPLIMISSFGGMNVEEVIERDQKKMIKIFLPHYGKIHDYQLFQCAKMLNWSNEIKQKGEFLIKNLVKVFLDYDASMLEINPLVLTSSQELSVVDAKMSIDDNALYRHLDLEKLFDASQETKEDVLARKMKVSYISLEGSIGCLVNGAGLAMATMDILNYYGGKAANFLDVGGSATEKQLQDSLILIISDPLVKVIFINIFGGILDCSVLAKALVKAYFNLNMKLPIVIRLEGTNSDKGREILIRSNIKLFFVDSIDEGAKKAIDISKGKFIYG